MGVVEVVGLTMSFAGKLMDMFPNYEQRKRKQFFKLKGAYEDELNKDFPDRDDERILELRDELLNFLKSFQKEIQQQDI